MYRTDARGRNERGMLGAELARGTTIDGWGRVERMTRGHGIGGATVTVYRLVKGKRGRVTIGDPRTYRYELRVPGTRYRTDVPAGPVGRKPGVKANGAHGDTSADRHHALIGNLTYA